MTCYLQQIINEFGKKISTRLCSESRKGLVFLWEGNTIYFKRFNYELYFICFILYYFSIVLLVGVQFAVYTANSSPFSTGRRFLSNICNISEIFYS